MASFNRPYTRPLTQPPDPLTRQQSKHYFKLIQVTHHQHIISHALQTGLFPTGMTRQVAKLTQFIKPALPTQHTRTLLNQNTSDWMQHNMDILLEHYNTQLTLLTSTPSPFNTLAFQIASGWARKRYHTRLSPTTLQTVQRLLNPQSSPHTTPTHPTPPHQTTTPTPRDPPTPTHSSDPSFLTEFPPLPAPTRAPTPPPKQDLGVMPHPTLTLTTPSIPSLSTSIDLQQVTFTINTPDLTDTLSDTDDHQHPPNTTHTTQNAQHHTKNPPTTPTPIDTSPIDTLPVSPTLTPPKNRPTIQVTALVTHTYNSQPTITQRPNTATTNTTQANHLITHLVPQDITPCLSPPGSTQVGGVDPGQSKPSRVMMSKGNKKANQLTKPNAEPSTSTGVELSGAPTPSPLPLHKPSPTPHSTQPLSPRPPLLRTPTVPLLSLPLFSPTYHKWSNNRLQEWHIRPNKPILFIGDSNLARIPPHPYPNIQIDSYPGATANHMNRLLEKTSPQEAVELLVLSVGTNNREHNAKATTNKQLHKMFKLATKVFPNANIYVPVINFSPSIHPHYKYNLTEINRYITTHLPHLQPLPADQFSTTLDHIHWTPEVASKILHFWCTQLNLTFHRP
ncbi:mucin-2-like [Alosa sapidissima]|uniref:mucin-2-like n=1 Tax=Alosa sapidissima TaxID=34773 RepID=UPI001C0A390B|nr:mucin-2-like [Alosa sapidissima]